MFLKSFSNCIPNFMLVSLKSTIIAPICWTMVQVHQIHDRRERVRILKQAKEVGPQAPRRSKVSVTIKAALGRVRERFSLLLIPAVKEIPGKKNSWPRFHLTTPILAEFLDNLTLFGGGDHRMVEAKQIVTGVSKYLAFADRSVVFSNPN